MSLGGLHSSAASSRTSASCSCRSLPSSSNSWGYGTHRARRHRPAAAQHDNPSSSAPASCKLYDLHNRLVPYKQAWDWQHQLVERAVASASKGDPADSMLLLQHPPVYTLGSGSTTDNLRFDPAASSIPLYRTERGGEVTYHGPGQLVMYPILNLQQQPHRQDLHWYLRSLEEVVIVALREAAGLEAERVPGLTGVWVDGHKLAAIGVRAKKWVTYHGLALNVVTDLTPFRSIVPCGIADKPVGSVRGMLEGTSMVSDPFLSDMPEGVQTGGELLVEMRYALLDAFQEVFGVELQEANAAADLPGAAELLQSPAMESSIVRSAAHA